VKGEKTNGVRWGFESSVRLERVAFFPMDVIREDNLRMAFRVLSSLPVLSAAPNAPALSSKEVEEILANFS
jgi:hypothetical protein